MASARSAVTRRKAVARMLKAIHAQESREACGRKAEEVADKLESVRLGAGARTVRDGFAETLAYTEFPPERWRRIRTNDRIERIDREIGRKTRVVGTFPDDNTTLRLATARLKYIAEHEWGKSRYLDMSRLEEMDELKGKAEGQKRMGPRTAKSICERILTVLSSPTFPRKFAVVDRCSRKINLTKYVRSAGLELPSDPIGCLPKGSAMN